MTRPEKTRKHAPLHPDIARAIRKMSGPQIDAITIHGWRVGFDPKGRTRRVVLIHDRLDTIHDITDPEGAVDIAASAPAPE